MLAVENAKRLKLPKVYKRHLKSGQNKAGGKPLAEALSGKSAPGTVGRLYPAVTSDIVIFTIREELLQLLLIQRAAPPYAGCWALPGGFVGAGEALERAAARELREETGVSGVYLEQLYTFGHPRRDPRGRVISVAYYALVPPGRIHPRPASDARRADWFRCDRLPPLAFDHSEIARMAQERLAAKLGYSTIAFQFLPGKFTLGELQRVYEIILGRALDKRNFRKRIMAYDCLQDSGETVGNGRRRPARLYALRSQGIEFVR